MPRISYQDTFLSQDLPEVLREQFQKGEHTEITITARAKYPTTGVYIIWGVFSENNILISSLI